MSDDAAAPFDFAGYQRKPFAWSYSALKNFETCPRRYAETTLWKRYADRTGEGGDFGNDVHKAFSRRIRLKEPFPLGMRHYEPIVVQLEKSPGKLYDEQKMAITAEFAPAGYFDPGVWFRSIIDAGVHEGVRMTILDWKTGKILDDDAQLASQAATVFHHMPEVEKITAAFVWLRDKATTKMDFTRADLPAIWNGLMPRVKRLEVSWRSVDFPPKPGRLCRKYCPVTSCPHHGR